MLAPHEGKKGLVLNIEGEPCHMLKRHHMSESIQYVILDIDGTLVDSNNAHAHAWVQAMATYGHWVSYDKVRPLIGMGADKILPELLALSQDSAEGRQINIRRKAIFLSEYLPNLHPFPMARGLLQRMREHGLELVVATSSEPDELQHLLRVIGPDVQDLFEEQITGKDVQHSKPDPDIVGSTNSGLAMHTRLAAHHAPSLHA